MGERTYDVDVDGKTKTMSFSGDRKPTSSQILDADKRINAARAATAKKKMKAPADDDDASSSFLKNFAGGFKGTIDPYAKKK
jgi:hypothetical protein